MVTPMEKWKCPKCGREVTARLASEVVHNCPKAKKNVRLKKVAD